MHPPENTPTARASQTKPWLRAGLLSAACGLLAACAASASGPPTLPASKTLTARRAAGAGSNPIQHVVIIIQENQSFDHLFAGANIPGANVALSGKIHTGATVALTQQSLGGNTDTSHAVQDFLADYDGGKMDGFDLNTYGAKPGLSMYTYINPAQIQPYIQMAEQYVLADNYFTSHIDASFVAHQYLIAAQANHAANVPNGKWGCDGTYGDYVSTLNSNRTLGDFQIPCFSYTTLADELDAAGLTWHFYAPYVTQQSNGGAWSAFQAVSQIYSGPDWVNDVISPETQILSDIPNGILSNVTWVVPDYKNSDHPHSHSTTGPAWVASIVNAIGESKFWDNTLIFVTWDEWGGEYDHVPPPYKDYDGDGFRVPLLCISPYAYAGVVNHTQLEAAGIPKYVEKTFGLSTLAAADARAEPADDGCTNASQTTPRSFSEITASFKRDYFMHEKPSGLPPDDL